MTEPRAGISGVVICLNEADRIQRCLESLAFCDEIVVVDSGSTDGTADIARRCGARVVEQPFLGYVKQKNFALDLARHDWVVCLDADEALSPELQTEIAGRLRGAAPPDADGYEARRLTHYLGVWHDRGDWYPDLQLRVFRRSRGHWVGRDPHDRVELASDAGSLSGRILHWNYRSFSEQIQTIDRYSGVQAEALLAEGVRFRLRDLLLRPPARFVQGYLLRGGYRLGLPGLIVAVSTAYYVFAKYAKLWELSARAPSSEGSKGSETQGG